jgi:hypothetical protein
MDNFRDGRTQVGNLLMALIIEDLGDQPQTVIIEGDAVREDRTVVINKPEVDPATGVTYLSNDLQRTRLKVALEDVPSSSSYRSQQLAAMSEAVKSLPPEYQAAVMPFMVSLMDVPYKQDVVEAIRKVQQMPTPEEVEQQTQEAVKKALTEAGMELKERELVIKERKADSEMKNLDAKAVQIGVQAAFSAMQAGAQIAQMPQIAPIADEVMKGAGYQMPNPGGVDPNFPVPGQPVMPMDQAMPAEPMPTEEPVPTELDPAMMEAQANTSPGFPPVPQDAGLGMRGIETPVTDDNLPA